MFGRGVSSVLPFFSSGPFLSRSRCLHTHTLCHLDLFPPSECLQQFYCDSVCVKLVGVPVCLFCACIGMCLFTRGGAFGYDCISPGRSAAARAQPVKRMQELARQRRLSSCGPVDICPQHHPENLRMASSGKAKSGQPDEPCRVCLR